MCLINLSYLFVASLVAFCEWPCHSIHQPSQIWSSNSCQKNKQFRSIWAHTTESSLVVSWSSAWIKWSSSQSVATCWGEDTFFIATLQYFSTHFSVWPVMSPKAVIFPNEVVLLFERVSSVSPVVANFLNNSVSDWAAWRSNVCIPLRAFPKHLICQWRWICKVDFVLQNVPHGVPWSVFPNFSRPRRHT